MIKIFKKLILKSSFKKFIFLLYIMETFSDLKIKILKKKILANFIIEQYSYIDKLYRYVHMGFAISTPLMTMLDYAATGNVNATFTTSLVLSAVVAGMVKIKEYMKFDKIPDIAKHQSLRYERLYKHIEAEEAKNALEREFIYWVNRAIIDIEQMDPELSAKDKQKFLEFLAENNIQWMTDIDNLAKLQKSRSQRSLRNLKDMHLDHGAEDLQKDKIHSDLKSNLPGDLPSDLKSNLHNTLQSDLKSDLLSDLQSNVSYENHFHDKSNNNDEASTGDITANIHKYNTTDDIRITMERLNALDPASTV